MERGRESDREMETEREKEKGRESEEGGGMWGGGRNTEKGRLGELDNEREKERGRELEWWKEGERQGLGKKGQRLMERWRMCGCVHPSVF